MQQLQIANDDEIIAHERLNQAAVPSKHAQNRALDAWPQHLQFATTIGLQCVKTLPSRKNEKACSGQNQAV